jgi:hypothetical protein
MIDQELLKILVVGSKPKLSNLKSQIIYFDIATPNSLNYEYSCPDLN